MMVIIISLTILVPVVCVCVCVCAGACMRACFVFSVLSVHTILIDYFMLTQLPYIQWCTEGGVWGFKPPPPKFRRPSKIVPNSTRL
jgi:hypothetical protein